MNTKKYLYILLIVIVAAGLFFTAENLKAQEKGTMNEAAISSQLQQIIQTQQLIISRLNEIKEELKIIKIRSTVKR